MSDDLVAWPCKQNKCFVSESGPITSATAAVIFCMACNTSVWNCPYSAKTNEAAAASLALPSEAFDTKIAPSTAGHKLGHGGRRARRFRNACEHAILSAALAARLAHTQHPVLVFCWEKGQG